MRYLSGLGSDLGIIDFDFGGWVTKEQAWDDGNSRAGMGKPLS